MRRAAHQLYDDAPLVFADPLAARVLQPGARVEDMDGEAIAARYFAGRADGLTVRGGMGRLACAWRGDAEGQ